MKVKQLIKSISSATTVTHTYIDTRTHTHRDRHTHTGRQPRSFAALQMHRTLGGNIQSRQNASSAPPNQLGVAAGFFIFFFLFLHSHPLILFRALHLALQFFYAGSRSTKMQLNAKTASLPGEQQTQQPVALLRCCSWGRPNQGMHCQVTVFVTLPLPNPAPSHTAHAMAFTRSLCSRNRNRTRRVAEDVRLRKARAKFASALSVASVYGCKRLQVCVCVCMTPSSQVLVEFSLWMVFVFGLRAVVCFWRTCSRQQTTATTTATRTTTITTDYT